MYRHSQKERNYLRKTYASDCVNRYIGIVIDITSLQFMELLK